MSLTSNVIYPNPLDCTLPTLVGLTGSSYYVVGPSPAPGGTGTLTLLPGHPAQVNCATAFSSGLNYFVTPQGVDELVITLNSTNAALTGSSSILAGIAPLFWPAPPVSFPSGSLLISQANGPVLGSSTQAMGLSFRFPTTVTGSTAAGGSWNVATNAAAAIPCRAWALLLFAITWPASAGTGIYLQATYF
jgi:hypothetical protein